MSTPTKHMTTPMFIYRHDHPNGVIVDAGASDFDGDRLTAEGWVDSPAKIKTAEEIAAMAGADALDDMTKDQLVEYAFEHSITVNAGGNKPEIVAAIRAAIQ